jgi:hypothetical protein
MQIKFEYGCYPPILEGFCPLGDITVFGTFFLSAYIHIYTNLLFGTLLCHKKIQIKFEFRSDPIAIYQFSALFSLCVEIFIWYLVHCFAIEIYRLSLILVLIRWFFTRSLLSDLQKHHKLSVYHTFFSLSACIYSFNIWCIVPNAYWERVSYIWEVSFQENKVTKWMFIVFFLFLCKYDNSNTQPLDIVFR